MGKRFIMSKGFVRNKLGHWLLVIVVICLMLWGNVPNPAQTVNAAGTPVKVGCADFIPTARFRNFVDWLGDMVQLTTAGAVCARHRISTRCSTLAWTPGQ